VDIQEAMAALQGQYGQQAMGRFQGLRNMFGMLQPAMEQQGMGATLGAPMGAPVAPPDYNAILQQQQLMQQQQQIPPEQQALLQQQMQAKARARPIMLPHGAMPQQMPQPQMPHQIHPMRALGMQAPQGFGASQPAGTATLPGGGVSGLMQKPQQANSYM
jgi:hypothetical protein